MTSVFCIPSQCFDSIPGLKALCSAFPERFSSDGKLLVLEGTFQERGFSIEDQDDQVLIRFNRRCDAFRAIGLVLAGCQSISQTCVTDSLGVMLDLSRNGVFKVEAIEKLFRSFALMGVNSVQLYMEDVFLLPDEPFFGYARGAYTREELRRIDDYGHLLGIEVIPCIQTLGHLEQVLQWPAYSGLQDTGGVLLVGAEKTYALIEKMLRVAKECFRSRRIHIGMDEAHSIGRGRYLDKNGHRRAFDILNEHLQRVVAICRAEGLSPMIWSDMYFRIGSKSHDYYDPNTVIPPEVIEGIPAEVELVYWDYYHSGTDFYEDWIEQHRSIGKEPIFAAGGWSWGRLWTHWPRARESISASMRAVRSQAVREAFITMWGDDGSECHPFSMLMAIQYFAEWAYVAEPDLGSLEKQFAVFSPDVRLSDSILASELDEIPASQGSIETEANFSKWILWHDPVLGFLDKHILAELPRHYAWLAEKLREGNSKNASELHFVESLASAVAKKSKVHLQGRCAYLTKDCDTIKELLSTTLPETIAEIRKLWRLHRTAWHQWYKPFGWEVIDSRYATVIARLEYFAELLVGYLKDPDLQIPEFEFALQSFYCEENPPVTLKTSEDYRGGGSDPFAGKTYFSYCRVTTPSCIK